MVQQNIKRQLQFYEWYFVDNYYQCHLAGFGSTIFFRLVSTFTKGHALRKANALTNGDLAIFTSKQCYSLLLQRLIAIHLGMPVMAGMKLSNNQRGCHRKRRQPLILRNMANRQQSKTIR
ncbi:MAG TPA: hypothetical protein DCM62_00980 [Bacteroidales bacterium]|nr:hypothetical protein [Bacteroidales bacterium]